MSSHHVSQTPLPLRNIEVLVSEPSVSITSTTPLSLTNMIVQMYPNLLLGQLRRHSIKHLQSSCVLCESRVVLQDLR